MDNKTDEKLTEPIVLANGVVPPAAADDSDLDVAIGCVTAMTDELRKLRAEKKTSEYEIERLTTANTINKDLLALLRKKLYWQNNMELVQLIDDTIRG